MNGKTNEISDYVQYRLDLDKANKEGPTATLDWYKAYSFLNAYQLDSAKLEDVSKLP